MIWLLAFIALELAVIFVLLDFRLTAIQRTMISASDLNLEAHQRLLDHFAKLERDSEWAAEMGSLRERLAEK